MICQYCGYDNPDGTLFCDDCSMPLPANPGSGIQGQQNNIPPQTNLANNPAGMVNQNPVPPGTPIVGSITNLLPAGNPVSSPNPHSGKPQLRLIANIPKNGNLPRLIIINNMIPTGESLPIPRPPYTGEILMGRNDLKNGMVVDIDLSSVGGYEKKVSRKHAYLGHDGKKFTIRDAGSSHGTFINKRKAASGQTLTLSPDDEIHLAELAFRIE